MKGQIALPALIAITMALIGGITTVYFKNDYKAQFALDKVAEIKAEIGSLKAEVNTKLDFILGRYGVNFNSQTGKVEPLVKMK